MADGLMRWFHLIGVAIWVGPQFFLFIAAIPSVRLVQDMGVRVEVMRKLTRRFLYLSGAGLALILIFGLAMVFDDSIYPDNAGDLRYGTIFGIKMGLFTLLLVAAAVHAFWIGPRMLDRQEEIARGRLTTSPAEAEAEVVQLRKLSMIVSGIGLLLALGAMLCGALLATETFSFQDA